MSLFAALDAVADRTQGAVFGGLFTHHPMARPAGDVNAPPIADTTRSVVEFTGILATVQTSTNLPGSYDPRTDKRPGVSVPAEMIEVPAGTAIAVKTGDIFAAPAADGRRWRVASTYVDDMGRTKATVNRI